MASDPRDKIYVLLDVVQEVNRVIVEDYPKLVELVMVELDHNTIFAYQTCRRLLGNPRMSNSVRPS